MDKKRSLLNVGVSIAFKLIVLLCTILTKRYVIRYLGNDINGLYSLYVSILSTLAVAELGIGSAITFCMYKPIVEKNSEMVSALYHLFTKIYLFVGGIILAAGIAVMPFLPTLAKGYENTVENLYLTFGLMLIATVLTYLFSSKSSLINAYKDNYITTSITSVAHIIRSLLQILSVIVFNSFSVYLICEIISVTFQWIATEFIVRKQHQDIIQSKYKRIDTETKNEVVKNVKAMFMHKIGGVLVNTSDSLIISAFIGITILGKYSNYVLIMTAAISLFSLLFTPLTSVIGHMFVESPNEAKKYFEFFHSFNFIVGMILSLGYYAIVNNLIDLLFKVGLNLPRSVVLIVTINYYIQFLRHAGLLFRDASGMFYYDRWKPAVEGVFNIVLSITFVNIFPEEYNVVGVIVATIITNLLICHVVEPYVLYKHAFKSSVRPYLLKNYFFIAVFIIALFILDKAMLNYDSSIKELLINGLISVVISSIVLAGLLITDKQFRHFAGIATTTVLRIK